MNCSKGDLALIYMTPDNTGKIVTCLEIVPPGTERCHDVSPLWRVDGRVIWWSPRGCAEFTLCPDRIMMPIRPLDEEEQLDMECHA